MKPLRFSALLIALTAVTLSAQTTTYKFTDGTTLALPDLTITGSALDCNVTYDASRAVYRYAYTLAAPLSNRVGIEGFDIDIMGKHAETQIDHGLAENIVRPPQQLQPYTAIPVGITVPDPARWRAGIGRAGMFFASARKAFTEIQPGSSAAGFVLESRLPPGIRKALITPSQRSWIDILDTTPDDGTEFVEPHPDVRNFVIATTVVGPADLSDADLFDGGGQQPAEVNKFMRYVAPTQSRNKVPANTTYTVVVYYGATINAATFSATLDGVDITSRFHPVPGGADAVKIAIGTATTKLHLSVDGTKASGGKGTDSDTLTFLPQ
jgi:hypothetical protein